VEVDVLGIPVPQGSKRVVQGHLIDVNHAKLRDWRQLVGAACQEAGQFFDGPVVVGFDFYFPRPKGHFGSGRNAEILKASSPAFPATKPDIDKLIRACLDAMTGIVFRDDAQVASLIASKFYADEQPPGVSITIQERTQ
jgi:Holliday junction resolvase RusA-like endonuclease